MSDNAVNVICKTALALGGTAAVVVLALFYKGDVAMLMAGILPIIATFWGAIHSQQTRDETQATGKAIAQDNKASNILMESKVSTVAEHVEAKADEVVAAVNKKG